MSELSKRQKIERWAELSQRLVAAKNELVKASNEAFELGETAMCDSLRQHSVAINPFIDVARNERMKLEGIVYK